MTKAEAQEYVWRCLAMTLHNDLHGVGAEYLTNPDNLGPYGDPIDINKVKQAAEDILVVLWRKAGEE